MSNVRAAVGRVAVGMAAVALAAGVARGQEAAAPAAAKAWSDSAEFSYVATAGNSEATTLGFKNTLGRKWGVSSFELKAGGIRAETTRTDRFAVGPSSTSFVVFENKDTSLSAESYFLNGRFDRKISEKFFWFAGGGWTRNEFAGIANRYEGAGGVGNIWTDAERVKFRTDYALSYTKEDDVVESPNAKDAFAGLRLSSKFMHKLGASTLYTNDLVVDENLDDTSDLRGDMVNSAAVAMSARLALKVSLQWVYDHQPAFREIDRFDAPPPPAGIGTKQGTVPDELDTLDTIFTMSLVVSF